MNVLHSRQSSTLPWLVVAMLCAAAGMVADASEPGTPDEFAARIRQIGQIEQRSIEATFHEHNRRLNETFREYVAAQGGTATAELVRQFNQLVADAGMSNFDDFLAAVAVPLRYVKDPATGAEVPVYGALGSDLINPWLAAMEILPDVPMQEQPAYICAANALREHVDFAIIGVADPNLSLDSVPPGLRPNCEQYYQQLNPTNCFDGGFDHPLFYATVRMAAMKLFREDHPRAKLSMDELVVSEKQGGLGINSCLLCHNRNHAEVYKRLLGEGLYLHSKSSECESEQEAAETAQLADTYLVAAEHVHEAFPDHIDAEQIRHSLTLLEADNLERLKPGYEEFAAALSEVGCLQCHSTESRVAAEFNPGQYGVYTLDPSSYHKSQNIQALLQLIDVHDLDNSLLLRKAMSRVRYEDMASDDAADTVTHEGAGRLTLDERQIAQLRGALTEWIHCFRDGTTKLP